MFEQLVHAVKHYLLIEESQLKLPQPAIWKLSVLRIALLIGIVLVSAIVIHSSYTAYEQGLYFVIYLTIGFSVVIGAALSIGKNHSKFALASLPAIIIAAGICIVLFIVELDIARYGLLFFFSLPIFLRLFYGNKIAIFSMALNIIPYLLLVRNQPIGPFFGIDISLPQTHTYLSSLLFLFFNICLPLSVIRIMTSLEYQSKQNLLQKKKLSKLVSQYQEIFNNGGTASFFCDQHGKILQANKSARKLIKKYQPHCRSIYQLFQISSELTPGHTQESSIVGAEDRKFELQPNNLVHHKKQLIHCIDISNDAAHEKKFDNFKKQHFEKHYYDSLTGLKNHHYWKKHIPVDSHTTTCSVLLKLANLKDVNIQFGYAIGDMLLKNIAKQLELFMPSKADVYFFPGARFLIVFKTKHTILNNIIAWLESWLPTETHVHVERVKPFKLEWRGGFTSSENSLDNRAIVDTCNLALAQTSQKDPFVIFNPHTVKLLRDQSKQKQRVKYLLDEGHLILYLQPQVDVNFNIIGYELLARLNEPKEGKVLLPYQFISIIEENNWHVLFTRKVLEQAIKLLETWPENMPKVPIAINLSGPELLNDIFYERLLRLYSEKKNLKQWLKIEITETSVLSSHVETKKRLKTLANSGVTIIIDDFGTGHASLSQLIDMASSTLKVDKEFVDNVDNSDRHRKIVKMTIDLAKSLNMEIIAEGVETSMQMSLLEDMGFNKFQGYLFGKPAPLEQWLGMYRTNKVGFSSLTSTKK